MYVCVGVCFLQAEYETTQTSLNENRVWMSKNTFISGAFVGVFPL